MANAGWAKGPSLYQGATDHLMGPVATRILSPFKEAQSKSACPPSYRKHGRDESFHTLPSLCPSTVFPVLRL